MEENRKLPQLLAIISGMQMKFTTINLFIIETELEILIQYCAKQFTYWVQLATEIARTVSRKIVLK